MEYVVPDSVSESGDDKTEASSIMEYASIQSSSRSLASVSKSISAGKNATEVISPHFKRPPMERQLGIRPYGGFATSRRVSASALFPSVSELRDESSET